MSSCTCRVFFLCMYHVHLGYDNSFTFCRDFGDEEMQIDGIAGRRHTFLNCHIRISIRFLSVYVRIGPLIGYDLYYFHGKNLRFFTFFVVFCFMFSRFSLWVIWSNVWFFSCNFGFNSESYLSATNGASLMLFSLSSDERSYTNMII